MGIPSKLLIFVFELTLLQTFAQAVFAAPHFYTPAFHAPSVVMGTYRITDVALADKSSVTNLCAPHRENGHKTGPNSKCGLLQWVVRNGSQLAILHAKPSAADPSPLESSLLIDSSVHRKCSMDISQSRGLAGKIFTGDFCRAFLDPNAPSASGEMDIFDFSHETPGLSQIPTSYGVLEGLFLAVGTTVKSRFEIEVPRGENSPGTIKVIEHVSGLAAGIPAEYQNIYTLTYVSR